MSAEGVCARGYDHNRRDNHGLPEVWFRDE